MQNNNIIISEGRVFLLSDTFGNMYPQSFQGFYFEDTRHISSFQTFLNNENMVLLNSDEVNYNRAVYVRRNKTSPEIKENSVTLIQDRIIDDGIFEIFKFINNTNEPITFSFTIRIDCDFDDILEIKKRIFFNDPTKVTRSITKAVSLEDSSVTFSYTRETYYRETMVQFSKNFVEDEKGLKFTIELEPKGSSEMSMTVALKNQHKQVIRPNAIIYNLENKTDNNPNMPQYPSLETDWVDLQNLYNKSTYDLSVLRIEREGVGAEKISLPAAGLPWFMTLFGRDSAITAYQMLGFDNAYATGVLQVLGDFQGTKVDLESEEEPGKILHEMRFGEMAHFKDWVKFPYYGSADATPLYLKLYVGLRKYYGNTMYFNEIKPSVRAAIDWIDKYGDIDHDLFVEYSKKTPQSIRNQNWRDSEDSMVFKDGTLAEGPISSADIQGYTYDAKMAIAEAARDIWKDSETATKLESDANQLKEKFNKEFWVEDGGYFALGLDKDKKKIDTLSSMIGHLLWSGIVDESKMSMIVSHLFSPELYSGWGIRTLSKDSIAFNPLGYHTGTVWPHDNAIIARGLYKNGFKSEALRIVEDMVDASKHFGYRLPEVFAGYDKNLTKFPVSYPTAASPQAWSASATMQFIKLLLGIDLDYINKKVTLNPAESIRYKHIVLKGFEVFGKKYNLYIEKGQTNVEEVA